MESFTAIKYLTYHAFSRHRNGYGLHSPFVFGLVTQTFRNKIESGIVNNIETVRKKLLTDKRFIEVDDLGTGSARLRSSERRISDIVKYSSVPRKYGIFLSRMAKSFGEPLILEFGTSLGISTMYLAASCPGVPLYTLEGCIETSALAMENFKKAGLNNIRLLTGSFDSLLPVLKDQGISPGLVFIDGDHRKDSLLRYFKFTSEISGDNTVVIIDDIYSGREISEAWELIKDHPKVTVTVDIFRMGLVFFREGVAKANYKVRY
jgi:predicted O-methyltransferase YrrM